MILILLLSAGVLLHINYVAATTCHELQQSQLISLNERMNHMIDTISSLLPKSMKKLTPPVPSTSTSSVDYLPGTASHENFNIPQPTYSTPAPSPHLVYIPTYSPPLPAVFALPVHSNPILTPHQNYAQRETGRYQEYPFSSMLSVVPQPPGIYYQHEHQFMYPNPTSLSHLASPLYPPNPYTFIQSPHSLEYTQPHPSEYAMPSPIYYNFPQYTSSVPLNPIPVPMFPNSSNLSQLPQKIK